MKKNIKLFGLLLTVLLIAGCSLLKEPTKTYTVNGISVTMKDDFKEKDLVSVTTYLESTDAIFTALKEEFVNLESVGINRNSTLRDYAEAVAYNNNLSSSNIIEQDGLVYFTYTREVSGKNFYYLATVYKSDDAFWLVNFACESKNKDSFEPKFIEWAKTVEFTK